MKTKLTFPLHQHCYWLAVLAATTQFLSAHADVSDAMLDRLYRASEEAHREGERLIAKEIANLLVARMEG